MVEDAVKRALLNLRRAEVAAAGEKPPVREYRREAPGHVAEVSVRRNEEPVRRICPFAELLNYCFVRKIRRELHLHMLLLCLINHLKHLISDLPV